MLRARVSGSGTRTLSHAVEPAHRHDPNGQEHQENLRRRNPESLRKGGLPRPVADVWAAGVGALAQARKKGGDSFETLIDLGTTVAETGGKAARATVSQVESAATTVADSARGLAGGAADGVQDRVEAVVETALARLGVPGRDEVLALQKQVEALQARIASLGPGGETAHLGTEAGTWERAVYEVTKHDRGWAVRRQGAERATAVHATKKEALVDARGVARSHAPSRLVVHKADGSVADETDYEA